MDIEIVWGTGEAQTELSAFDAALADAGIHNYNHVRLSSVIPPDATVTESGTHEQQWEVGTVIASVLASTTATRNGETIAAGLGWRQADRGGVFFEETASSRTGVDTRIQQGIEAAMSNRPDWKWDENIYTRVVEHTVDTNGAAVVAALYRPIQLRE